MCIYVHTYNMNFVFNKWCNALFKKIILCYGFQLYSLGDCFYISYFFVSFYRGKYRIVYLTPEFCSGNLDLLQQLEANIGKWNDRIFISTY